MSIIIKIHITLLVICTVIFLYCCIRSVLNKSFSDSTFCVIVDVLEFCLVVISFIYIIIDALVEIWQL
jgi:isoprenylcysteine carboxyl methyltransferase (ICMT) family protein YpbQ